MKLNEIYNLDEKESERMFRRLVMDLTKYASHPFKPEKYEGKPNPWHLTSGNYQTYEGELKNNYISAHLINDEGENYVQLHVVVPNNASGEALIKRVEELRLKGVPSSVMNLNKQNAISLSVKVYDV